MAITRPNDLSVTVENREKMLYQGPAWAISSTNVRGNFDILPNHSNFITLIKNQVVVHTEQGEQKFSFKDGALWITDNVVKVCLSISPETPAISMHKVSR